MCRFTIYNVCTHVSLRPAPFHLELLKYQPLPPIILGSVPVLGQVHATNSWNFKTLDPGPFLFKHFSCLSCVCATANLQSVTINSLPAEKRRKLKARCLIGAFK